jgi:hypothetical protein
VIGAYVRSVLVRLQRPGAHKGSVVLVLNLVFDAMPSVLAG